VQDIQADARVAIVGQLDEPAPDLRHVASHVTRAEVLDRDSPDVRVTILRERQQLVELRVGRTEPPPWARPSLCEGSHTGTCPYSVKLNRGTEHPVAWSPPGS
jgi:hypothetical protein